jgi:hypothetical protein
MPTPVPQQHLREVIARAFDDLEGRDAETVAACAGGRLADGVVEIELLGRGLAVDLRAREMQEEGEGDGALVDDFTAAVVARHLALADKLPGDLGPDVSFADDEDARGYLGPFRGRVLGPLLGRFGSDPEGFARAAEALAGERLPQMDEIGALGYRLRVFPRVALVFVLHPGDDELPAEGQVLFPREVLRTFDVEDAVTTAELASRALRGKLRARRT